MRDLSWEKREGLIRGTTSLSFDGSQPESCSGCLDPRDGSISFIASHRLAPRAKIKTRSSFHVPYSNRFKTIVRICKRLCKKNSKEFEIGLAKYSLGASELQHPSTMQKLPSRITPKIPYYRPAVGSGEAPILYTSGLPKKISAPRCFKL